MSSQTSSIGSCPSHWDVVKFSTVAELKHGYQFRTTDFTDQGVKVLKITQIKDNGSIDISSCSFIDSKRLESFEKNIVNKGDILMALSGATIGKIGRYKSEEIVLQNYRVGNFIPLNEEVLNKDYFYHFLTTENTYYQILANQNQSAQENIGKEDIHNMLVFIPPFPEQTAIASLLSSLDDKIDLLHRQNATLEKMAETLFRQWFVEEAKEDWEEYKVRDIAEHLKVNVIPSKQPSTFFHHYSLPAFDASQNPIREVGIEILSNKYKVFPESILVSKLNPSSPRIWAIGTDVKDNSICSTEFQVFKPQNIELFGYLFFLLKSDDAKNALKMAASGTSGSHQRVRPEDISNIPFALPNIDLAIEFSKQSQSILNKINHNQIQIRTLTTLRDTLLPKLMSGEVRVNIVEINGN